MNRDTAVVTTSVVAVLGTGGMLTTIGPWYFALRKPWFQPPGWLFGPAWTTIGLLTGLAARRSWRAARTRQARRRVVLLFGLNGILNALWSGFFFHRRRPDWALAEIVPLWLSIVSLIVFLPRPQDDAAARAGVADAGLMRDEGTWLLAPYLAWVSFATVLNAAIVRLNAPFE